MEDDIIRGAGEIILLVEDMDMVLEMGRRMLERLGYVVLAARSPSEAILILRNLAYGVDLLLTDVVLPGMSGFDLAARVRELCPKVRTLYMSGYTAEAIERLGVHQDDANFVQKPFSMKDIAAKVSGVLLVCGNDVDAHPLPSSPVLGT